MENFTYIYILTLLQDKKRKFAENLQKNKNFLFIKSFKIS